PFGSSGYSRTPLRGVRPTELGVDRANESAGPAGSGCRRFSGNRSRARFSLRPGHAFGLPLTLSFRQRRATCHAGGHSPESSFPAGKGVESGATQTGKFHTRHRRVARRGSGIVARRAGGGEWGERG